jgi:DNA-binding XRE family transcriptional regulator
METGNGVSDFGGQLRRWRQTRRLSQLQLAVAAGVSPRHLSVIETGRSQPSRLSLPPHGLRSRVSNFEQYARQLVARLRHDATAHTTTVLMRE